MGKYPNESEILFIVFSMVTNLKITMKCIINELPKIGVKFFDKYQQTIKNGNKDRHLYGYIFINISDYNLIDFKIFNELFPSLSWTIIYGIIYWMIYCKWQIGKCAILYPKEKGIAIINTLETYQSTEKKKNNWFESK